MTKTHDFRNARDTDLDNDTYAEHIEAPARALGNTGLSPFL